MTSTFRTSAAAFSIMVNFSEAILHPLRRAPPELMCEIFACTLDDSGNDNGLGYAPPWYLGQICRSWRLCALAYPRLWSLITVPSSPAFQLPKTFPPPSRTAKEASDGYRAPLDVAAYSAVEYNTKRHIQATMPLSCG
ncbi:hypothetical protein DFH06DRAFT_1410735 [Mycena polygramma]|nr:hypothetical protein DFH06DRAFT_1410735 [Mycena polygramma]